MFSKQLILKRGVVRTELEESTRRIKIKYLSLELYHVNTDIFMIFLVKIEVFDDAVSIFATGTGESDPPLFFCKLWNTIYREIINVMTIMMKTIKNVWIFIQNISWWVGVLFIFRIYICFLASDRHTISITPWLGKANCQFWILV